MPTKEENFFKTIIANTDFPVITKSSLLVIFESKWLIKKTYILLDRLE